MLLKMDRIESRTSSHTQAPSLSPIAVKAFRPLFEMGRKWSFSRNEKSQLTEPEELSVVKLQFSIHCLVSMAQHQSGLSSSLSLSHTLRSMLAHTCCVCWNKRKRFIHKTTLNGIYIVISRSSEWWTWSKHCVKWKNQKNTFRLCCHVCRSAESEREHEKINFWPSQAGCYSAAAEAFTSPVSISWLIALDNTMFLQLATTFGFIGLPPAPAATQNSRNYRHFPQIDVFSLFPLLTRVFSSHNRIRYFVCFFLKCSGARSLSLTIMFDKSQFDAWNRHNCDRFSLNHDATFSEKVLNVHTVNNLSNLAKKSTVGKEFLQLPPPTVVQLANNTNYRISWNVWKILSEREMSVKNGAEFELDEDEELKIDVTNICNRVWAFHAR